MERSQKFEEVYISQMLTLQRLTNFRSHSSLKTIKIALIPMIKTITASNLLQNPQKTKLGSPQMHLGKVTILHISLRSIAEYFAKNSLRSFGKIFCKQFASLIWQKKSLSRANFAYFASLNICKIILNVRSAHYLQINLCTLAMLAHKLGPSLDFFGCLT